MSANNVGSFKAAHEEFNRRQFDALLNRMSENCTYRDHARLDTLDSCRRSPLAVTGLPGD
jgi:hypothetical protein